VNPANPDAQRTLLANLIERLETEELPFYERASSFNFWAWHFCAITAFLVSILSGALASLIPDDVFRDHGRIYIAVLSFASACATGLLAVLRFREKEALREEGRIEMQDIIDNAHSLLASCETEKDCERVFHQVRERNRQFQLAQHRQDIALRSDALQKLDHGPDTVER
jgi:hypothetical protein